MGLRINTNVPALNSARTLDRSTRALNRSLERLSGGLRINRAADDASGLAVAEGFRTEVLGAQVAQRNAQDGISLVQTADGALGETTNILQRVRELALQAANGTQSTANRAALNTEVQELIAQVEDIALDTQFNGIAVLSANQSITLQTGSYVSQTLRVAVAGARTSDLRISALFVSSVAGAVSAISLVDVALASVNSLRSTLGAFQNRLEFTVNTLAIQEENAAAAQSVIRDVDFARETILFTRNQLLVNAGINVLVQTNVAPKSALDLLSPP